MLRATLIVASRVPNEGATSGSNAGVVKLSTNKLLCSARSIHWQRREKIIMVFIRMYSWTTFRIKVHRKTKKGHWTTTWSKRIWQQSGVKCCRVASVLLSIFSRLHCTASRAFCSASSLPVSPPPAGFLDGVCGGRCGLGSGPGGNASPFLT